MNALESVVNENLAKYDDLNEFLDYYNLEKEDFKNWEDCGYSDDGFIQIMDSYCLAGNATTGELLPLTSIKEVTNLILEEIRNSNFNDTIELLNNDIEDNNEKIDPSDTIGVMQLFFEFCHEIALIPSGKSYILVINED